MADAAGTWARELAEARRRQTIAHDLQSLRGGLESMGPGPQSGAQEASLRRRSTSEREFATALESLDRLETGGDLNEDQLASLEAIVEPDNRPVIDIVGGRYTDIPWNWPQLGQPDVRARIERAIGAVGRVEVTGNPRIPYGGTGFLVGDGLMMTNRHVAELFTSGLGRLGLRFRSGMASAIDFKQEVVPSPPELFDVADVVMVHPYWDCALLKVRALTGQRTVLTLASAPPAGQIARRPVVIVGYPAFDPRNEPDLQRRIFRVFERKRLQPGELKGYGIIHSFEQDVEALTHDVSTLGGNSGSAVIDMETGTVLGLHFAGVRRKANYAVPAWELARDRRVVEAGVSFTQGAPQMPAAPWLRRWSEIEQRAGVTPWS